LLKGPRYSISKTRLKPAKILEMRYIIMGANKCNFFRENNLNQIDIIIVNYNSTNYLLSCLKSTYDSLDGLSAKVFPRKGGGIPGRGRIHR
jgi:hypothetical protein